MKHLAVAALLVVLIVLATWRPGASRAQTHDRATAPATAPNNPFTDVREMASTLAGHPRPGEDVEVGLLNRGAPEAFNTATAGGMTFTVTGRVTAFDAAWVGLESSGSGRKLWIPRENVAYVITSTASVKRKKD